ncbi:hypothetical protein [Amnibacterium setariae]|uniref:Glycosyltransferase family 2 protein n=1 Tax=Amnibacterium setariae TaxID=2306585 RepID=A0A3A1U0M4_9MICO|nr:hypothetical protein [Amnibacterium setariae]RIX30424.1 hypothetical protein D1781_03045 [Amnibacterium setariae]
MQPQVALRPQALEPDGLVLAVLRTSGDVLRTALQRIEAAPELLALATRVVVLDPRPLTAASRPAGAGLPDGLLRVVRRPGADAPAALAAVLAAALTEAAARAVLVVEDRAVLDPEALVAAAVRSVGSAAGDVVGLVDPSSADASPRAWWAAVLPFDALRAVGSALPEAGGLALADLVLRADAAGFRPAALRAPGPARTATAAERVRIALLHEPVAARSRVLAGGLARQLRALVRLRHRAAAQEQAELLAVLGERPRRAAPGALPADAVRLHVRLWLAWPALRRRAREGALERASAAAWAERNDAPGMDGERERAGRRPAGLQWRAWATSKRGTSAA